MKIILLIQVVIDLVNADMYNEPQFHNLKHNDDSHGNVAGHTQVGRLPHIHLFIYVCIHMCVYTCIYILYI